MKAITLRISKKKIIFCLAVLLLAAALFVGASLLDGARGTPGGRNDQRVSFLRDCGWEVAEEPVSAREIQVPAAFSDVYENYAKLNLQAGFDLHQLQGKTCLQYVYQVKNYEGRSDVHATVLVWNGWIAGGDLSTAALDGFMVPLRVLA